MKWLKNLFFKEEEPEEEELDFEEIEVWFDRQVVEKIEGIKSSIKSNNEKISQLLEKMDLDLEKLEEAELKNKNIPVRALQIMEGNRGLFIKLHRAFAQSVSLPEEINLDEIQESFDGIMLELKNLGEQSQKCIAVLHEFFSDESGKAREKVKDVAELIKENQDILKNEYRPIVDIKELIEDVHKKIEKRKALNKEIESHKNDLKSKNLYKEKMSRDIEGLKSSSSFTEVGNLNNKKEELVKLLKQNELDILNFFSPLQRPLKKFARITLEGEELVYKYIEDPVGAVMTDEDLQIYSLLQDMKRLLEEDKIELKDKSKEKVISLVSNFDKSTIMNFVGKQKQLKDSLMDIKRKLTSNRVMNDLEELNYKHTHAVNAVEQQIKKIEELTETAENINIRGMMDDLQKDISEVTGVPVVIK